MVTELGKELRKLRLDLGITLFEMAKEIDVSSSFLSAVETGKKAASPDLIEAIANRFDLVNSIKAKLENLANKTRREVRIKLTEDNVSGAELATAFARNFSELTEDQKEQIKAILNKKDVK